MRQKCKSAKVRQKCDSVKREYGGIWLPFSPSGCSGSSGCFS